MTYTPILNRKSMKWITRCLIASVSLTRTTDRYTKRRRIKLSQNLQYKSSVTPNTNKNILILFQNPQKCRGKRNLLFFPALIFYTISHHKQISLTSTTDQYTTNTPVQVLKIGISLSNYQTTDPFHQQIPLLLKHGSTEISNRLFAQRTINRRVTPQRSAQITNLQRVVRPTNPTSQQTINPNRL